LKPVFLKEHERYKKYAKQCTTQEEDFPNILFRKKNQLISDKSKGNIHFTLNVKQDHQDTEQIHFRLDVNENSDYSHGRPSSVQPNSVHFLKDAEYMDKLFRGNEPELKKIEEEAIGFIKDMSKKYNTFVKIISFSGGKDSSVTAYLVKKAIGDVLVAFSNTGIEYKDTVKYVEEHGSFFGILKVLDPQNDFYELCEELGIPSRVMRWCCSTQKATPINRFYAQIGKNMLSFDGIRKAESKLRSEYPREKDNTKLVKQLSVYPILEWNELEVWLYILWQKIPYNPLYDEGFSRIGCWCCPNNSMFDAFLFCEVYPNEANVWFRKIDSYRDQQSEKISNESEPGSASPYDVNWLLDGAWKGRRVKYHDTLLAEKDDQFVGYDDVDDAVETREKVLEDGFSGLSSPCGKHDFTLKMEANINERVLEFFKVFGPIQETTFGDKKQYIIKGRDIFINFLEGSNIIKFNIFDENKTKELLSHIKRQLNKSFNCINCGACMGTCSQGAIGVNDKFFIDEKKCKQCYVCCTTKYLHFSCVALHYKEDRKLVRI
jgi:phosphoadenosine phosphosulfate reductase